MLIKFEFTKEEIEERTILTGDPPVPVFMRKNQTAIVGKKPYTTLLCEKISQLIPSHPTIVVDTSFTRYKDVVRAYVKCKEHNHTSPVQFQFADLKQGHPLSFEFKQTCVKCELTSDNSQDNEQRDSDASLNGSDQTNTDLVIHLPTIGAPVELLQFFQGFGRTVISALNKKLGEFSAAPDYVLAVQSQKESFGAVLDREWKLAVDKAFPAHASNLDTNDDEIEQENDDAATNENLQPQNALETLMSNRALLQKRAQEELLNPSKKKQKR